MAVTVTGPYAVAGYDGYTFYKFTGAGSVDWTIPSDCDTVDVTVVGGGGAPYSRVGGGGGYMVSRFSQPVSGSVTVVVAAGATASLTGDVTGGTSSFGSISAEGGTGMTTDERGGDGGSGGGYWGYDGGSNGSNGLGTVGKVGIGQGTGSTERNPAPCSGTTGIDGVLRCGGGGGTTSYSEVDGYGGAGGGGNSSANSSSNGGSGTNDYGGGGGGRYNSSQYGGNGGSGIVIVRYIPKLARKKGQPHINSGGVLII